MAQQTTITPSERIRELSEINNDVANLLSSAGQAIHALTNRPLNMHRDEDTRMNDGGNGLEAHKEAFEYNTNEFFEGLQGVMARLRRQAYALEEAGIITPDRAFGNDPPKATPPQQQGLRNAGPQISKEQKLDPERIKNGGLGNFDVGWLNSRGNKVGAEKEAELIKEAKELLEQVLARESAGS